MKRMRRILTVLLCLLMVFSLVSCKKENNNNVQPAPSGKAYPDRDVDLPTEIPKLNEDSIQIHYGRKDNAYGSWTLWLWDPEGTDDGLEDDFNYQDDYGVVASYPLSHFGNAGLARLGFIVKMKGNWTKDGTDSDRFANFSLLKKDENNVYHIYLYGDDENIYATADRIITDEIQSAAFRDGKNVLVTCTNPTESFKIYKDGQLLEEGKGAGRSTFQHTLQEEADFAGAYSIEVTFRASGLTLKKDIDNSGLYTSESFEKQYYYDGQLGAIYTKNKTTFRVWSPVSTSIYLRIYENGTPRRVDSNKGDDACIEYVMEKKDKGVFEYVLSGDQQGKYYTYVVFNKNHPDGAEIVDPYAKSAGISGLRGMVVDFSKTNPAGWDKIKYLTYDRKQLAVWETHVADVTSSDSWTGSAANKRHYLGMIEPGTTYTQDGITVKTGFDHIKELGVNAVQLQPIFDQANDETKYVFNWGYNPLNYNVLEGMYSSDPYDGYNRIKEFKQVVMAFNKAGITTIMDVVYNHVNGAVNSNWDVLMPGYYYRYNVNGTLSNGSGCGNEVASEKSMVRKFIVDSISFWLKEYNLGGFRFDLMALHDIETMNQVAAAAKKINANCVIYGEPWTGGTSTLPGEQQAKQDNANQYVGYGQFNDQMRDAMIKGGLNAAVDKGWVTNNAINKSDVTAIEQGLNGVTYKAMLQINDPNKTVNYATCHDNYTLYDRIKAAGITDEDTIRKMAVLANSLVLTSNGTSFFLAGEEFLRTKKGDSNSYQSSDEINQLDYALKVKNLDIFENYKKLVAFKKSTAALASNSVTGLKVTDASDGAIIVSSFTSNKKSYMIVYANGAPIKDTVDASGYTVVLDTLGQLSGKPGVFTPANYQTVILVK